MIESIVAILRLVEAGLGPVVAPDHGVVALLLVGAAALAAVGVVLVAREAVPDLVAADPARAASRHRQTVDRSRLLAQSDPDAPGRPRPRAPGALVSAA